MKTPIAYYGGKQQLAGKIVRILAQAPAQKIYCEPFFGRGRSNRNKTTGRK